MGFAREYEGEARRRGAPPSRRASRGRADGVLGLQRLAGNRAVRSLLARRPRAQPKQPAEAEQRTSHVVLPGLGRIALDSFGWTAHERVGGGAGKANLNEIQVTTTAGEHSAALQRAVAEGRHFKKVELVHHGSKGGVRLRMTDVVLVSYQILHESSTGVSEQWSLSFGTLEHEYLPND